MSHEHVDTGQPERLRTAWRELRAQRKVRQRDAAELLGVSEAELVASDTGEGVTRLEGDARAMLDAVQSIGRVMALTRNPWCVHEKIGVYENLAVDAMVGLALGEDIDLRLFFSHWKHAFAVTDVGPGGILQSLQFYDANGNAVHKIFLKEGADVDAYRRVVARFAAATQTPRLAVEPATHKAAPLPLEQIDGQGLRAAWSNLRDTHEFFGMLRKFKVTRIQAMQLAGPDLAHPAPLESARRLLEDVATSGLPIMVFVGNPGCIQIHTGPVHNVRMMENWLNVMDPGFNLHLREDGIHSAWIVRKPTVDGVVTSLELFDAQGETIAMLFGKRKPGIPEMAEWRGTIERLFPLREAMQ